ncbi:aldehyde dehydrogenase: molybdenum cofactor-binding subunit [Rhodovastum atsumiense]|uniref:Xanthine dehydrogenase family protein molybdopterin-binding subunit n=1 Tax=Rhodovastum atsumiense TaxID=504468 RepID=A0A5M6INY1_9PROT|nr:xanthine dehydrogenase family protein molybdopterin-binding subunit [Rhodovastum atsumiense]KAA5609175.1 xanthine dehydrogenase family protein molybdopterin-binding subunit [Rhodovastum atsumiense]CAH2602840.1 aldehyde dehydrogenase: molybdenum cofactor-binding subunit [Rhodovastum atsumiense]
MPIADFITENRGGHVGLSAPRADGPAKVTGQARYAAEHHPHGLLHGFPVLTILPAGRIRAINTREAERAPGVVAVVTRANAPDMAPFVETDDIQVKFIGPKPVLDRDEVLFHGQSVALVLAESFEAARAAAALVTVEAEPADAALSFADALPSAYRPNLVNGGAPPDTAEGDFVTAFAAAPVQLDTTYTTPYEHNNPIEPHAAVAEWRDGRLIVQDCNQGPWACAQALAATFKLPPDRVQVISRFIGGGFGSKYGAHPHAVLAAIGARVSGRPCKVALTRQQVFTGHGHRSATRQRLRLGAQRDGHLVAIAHDTWVQTSRHDEMVEQSGVISRIMYAAPHRRTTHRVVRLNTPTPSWMRAPGEAPGSFALESAMDELAHALDMDPIALRLANEPDHDPESGLPWSSRSLRACLQQGAERFGWQRRGAPGSRREGRWRVGLGVASATYPVLHMPASARLTMHPDGSAKVELAATDIGTGTYTILRQLAAAALGLAPGQVEVALGDSDLPMTMGSGGSFGASSAGSALAGAATALRAQLADLARQDPASPLHGLNSDALAFADGRISHRDTPARGEALATLLARAAPEGLSVSHDHHPDTAQQHWSMHAFGAQFAEVGVDGDTGEVRVRRMLGAYGAGRILNPRTATSQIIGGITMGIGQALMEETLLDPRWGQWVNRDLGEYHVPTNADVPVIEALFVEEHDEHVNALGAKGIGEIGIVGAAAAIANAVFNATGVRVRDLPITLEKVLAR